MDAAAVGEESVGDFSLELARRKWGPNREPNEIRRIHYAGNGNHSDERARHGHLIDRMDPSIGPVIA